MVHRELKVTTITCIFEETAFERYYFNKVHTFSKEILLDNVAEHKLVTYIIKHAQRLCSLLHTSVSSLTE